MEGPVNGQVWKRCVAGMCREAWELDRTATVELVRCIEELIDTHGDAGAVQVFLGACAAGSGRRTRTFRIEVSDGGGR